MQWTLERLLAKYQAWLLDHPQALVPSVSAIRSNPRPYLPGLKTLGLREGWFGLNDTLDIATIDKPDWP